MQNNYFNDLLLKNNIKLTDKQIEQFEFFKNELISWNNKINLTRITEEKDIYTKHFFDSLVPCKYINENDKIIDIGTGAGFPGIPIKIYFPNIKITLLDSVNKKILYLEDIIKKHNFNNINVIHGRAEDVANNKEYRECYDVAISRAVANMSTLVEYLLPFVKVNGKVICMKGPNIIDELEKSKKAINILGGKIEDVYEYKLPDTDIKYNLIIIKKEKETPAEYPRKAGMPSEKPL